MGENGYTTIGLQYWYVFLALTFGLLSIILFNLITYFYFLKRQPIDPVKLFTEIESEISNDVIDRESSFFFNQSSILEQENFTNDNEILSNDDNIDLNQFRMEALATHNDYREKHNAPPLQYSEDLSVYAQFWAENMAKTNRLVHSPVDWRIKYNNETLGENVVLTNGFKLTGKSMTDMWYSESYKHKYQELQKDTKSFTQLIWVNSKKVGFGRAKSSDGKWYGCAHYYPEGNIIGLFKNNVYPINHL